MKSVQELMMSVILVQDKDVALLKSREQLLGAPEH